MKQSKFSTRWGFILSAVGSAVGMANVWGFPAKMGANGGGAFLVAYLIFIALFSVVGLSAEYVQYFSYVWLYLTPSPLEVNLKFTPNEISAGEYIDVTFTPRSNYPSATFENFQIVILDGDAEVVDKDTIYILPTAVKGDTILVCARWTDEYGRVKEYHYYTLTV